MVYPVKTEARLMLQVVSSLRHASECGLDVVSMAQRIYRTWGERTMPMLWLLLHAKEYMQIRGAICGRGSARASAIRDMYKISYYD